MTAHDDIAAFLRERGLAAPEEPLRFEPLAGGVSSDIWRVTTATRRLCVKRALARLRVAAVWEAPTSRNASEWDWLELVSHLLPDAVPALYAHDGDADMFAMAYLDPADYPVWKEQLRDGLVSLATAETVGRLLGTVHALTADDRHVAARFATDPTFYALRLQPYLIATADAHPALREELEAIARTTATTRRVLVHGDVSPKNLLIGPRGPVFLDAECAWFGDPAFDLSFVLNHLLLKGVWRPQHAAAYVAAFRALARAYTACVTWETVDALERRCARLLPALTLARIDGTSPVEYLTDERDRETVRAAAIALIRSAPESLDAVLGGWLRSAASAA
jgi:aminoglycoside phosphotransferase (APT) family kinase protein